MASKGTKNKKLVPDLKDKENPWGSKYNESMCIEVIEMYAQGKNRAEFCAAHYISGDTFEKWKKRHFLFAEAVKVAHERARTYYDNMRARHLELEMEEGKPTHGLNHALFNRMYNTRFNVPDKRAVTVKTLGSAKDERSMLKAIMKAVSDGDLTPDEAQKLASLIDVSLKVKVSEELEQRISQIEQAQKVGLTDDDFEEVGEEGA